MFELPTASSCLSSRLRAAIAEASETVGSALALPLQLSGWTVAADRLNLNRFLSHFRAVHRGQFFAQMKTTAVGRTPFSSSVSVAAVSHRLLLCMRNVRCIFLALEVITEKLVKGGEKRTSSLYYPTCCIAATVQPFCFL